MALETKIERNEVDLTIQVTEKNNVLGKYYIYCRKGLATGRLDSFESGRGIPRSLINTASKELQNIANGTRTPIQHEVTASFGRAKEVLPHLFIENGYHPDNDLRSTTFSGYSKTYSPQ